MNSKIEKILIEIGIDVARKGEGALFVISDSCKYKTLLKQKFQSFNIKDEGAKKILLSISTIDGAVIINHKGKILDYAAMIEKKGNGILKGKGTRHQAAISASLYPNSTSILVSQEEKNVKLFKSGKMIMKIDALNENIKKEVTEVSKILESLGFGTATSIASVSLVGLGILPFGIALAPGVVVFGAPYYILKKLREHNK